VKHRKYVSSLFKHARTNQKILLRFEHASAPRPGFPTCRFTMAMKSTVCGYGQSTERQYPSVQPRNSLWDTRLLKDIQKAPHIYPTYTPQ